MLDNPSLHAFSFSSERTLERQRSGVIESVGSQPHADRFHNLACLPDLVGLYPLVFKDDSSRVDDAALVGLCHEEATARTTACRDRAVELQNAYSLAEHRPAYVVSLDEIGLRAEKSAFLPPASLDVVANQPSDTLCKLSLPVNDARAHPRARGPVMDSAPKPGIEHPNSLQGRGTVVFGDRSHQTPEAAQMSERVVDGNRRVQLRTRSAKSPGPHITERTGEQREHRVSPKSSHSHS